MSYLNTRDVPFETLLGKTLLLVAKDKHNEAIVFVTSDGAIYYQFHQNDCCESVTIEDINGDFADLVGTPILLAEEATSTERPDDVPEPEYKDDSQTWTFYRLATVKGAVIIRWYGTSNGYYSESVSFVQVGTA
jgi:hypothetical protein